MVATGTIQYTQVLEDLNQEISVSSSRLKEVLNTIPKVDTFFTRVDEAERETVSNYLENPVIIQLTRITRENKLDHNKTSRYAVSPIAEDGLILLVDIDTGSLYTIKKSFIEKALDSQYDGQHSLISFLGKLSEAIPPSAINLQEHERWYLLKLRLLPGM